MKMKHFVFSAILGAVIVGAGVGGFLLTARGASRRELPEEVHVIRPVPVAEARSLSGRALRFFPGKARANLRVELAFSVPGLVEKLNAREGRNVKQGEVLARLDRRDYLSHVEAARARFVQAEKDLARFSALRDQKVVAEVKYEAAKTAYDIALAELHLRRKALEDTVLLAPFDGLVVRRYVENHEHVQAKQPVLSFQDVSLAEVVIQVSERQIAQGGVAGLGRLEVCFDADRERWLSASICEYSAESDPITGTYDVVISLVPPPDLEVLPGMTATVRARIPDSLETSPSAQQMTRIPVEALCSGNDGHSYVWVIDPAGGNPLRREVEAVSMCEDCVQIRSGLRAGEYVAVAGLSNLRDDMRVRPMTIGAEGLDG